MSDLKEKVADAIYEKEMIGDQAQAAMNVIADWLEKKADEHCQHKAGVGLCIEDIAKQLRDE